MVQFLATAKTGKRSLKHFSALQYRCHARAYGEGMDLTILQDAKCPIPLHAYAAFLAVVYL